MTNKRDRLYRKPQRPLARFAFDEPVAAVFPDMLARSVPGYALLLELLGLVAEHHWQPGGRVYDLGCSTGAATAAVHARLGDKPEAYIAVDQSEAMLKRCRAELGTLKAPLEIYCADLREVQIQKASIVILNLTLQFINIKNRLSLLRDLRTGMLPGGVLLLAEKTAPARANKNRSLTSPDPALHEAFKRAHGYSDLEISQKRQALEKVLRCEPAEAHRRRLRRAGFTQIYPWFQALNFTAFAAVK